MRLRKRVTALLLSAILLLTLSACGKKDRAAAEEAAREEELAAEDMKHAESVKTAAEAFVVQPETEEDEEETGLLAANDYIVPDYEHYDPTQFETDCDRLERYAGDGDLDRTLKLYDDIYEEFEYINAIAAVIYGLHCEDVTNTEYQEEYEYTDSVVTECLDRFLRACHSVTESPVSEGFRDYIADDEIYDVFTEHVDMTAEEKELSATETTMTNLYYELMDSSGQTAYKLGSKIYTLDDLTSGAERLKELTEEEYSEVYMGVLDSLNRKLGEVFMDLCRTRDRIARLNDYDSYSDYADKEIFGRDYSGEELTAFYDAVREALAADSDILDLGYYMLPEMELSTEDQINALGKLMSGVSDYTREVFHFFQDNHLYSIGDESCRAEVGFTITVPGTEHGAYIFNKSSNSLCDLLTLIHELGHFTQSYKSAVPTILTGSYDLFEIHSSGLEMLTAVRYDKLFDAETAERMTAYDLSALLRNIVDGCIMDEWQRAVYADPNLTLDEINALYRDIRLSYGEADYPGMEYGWMWVSHNFVSPMYYISYAASSIVALQLWDMAQSDYEKAVSAWEYFIDVGAPQAYQEVVEEAGLASLTDGVNIADTLRDVLAYYKDVMSGYQVVESAA